MAIQRLDHVNIVTARLDDMIAWYASALGMATGPRPDFPFPGAWLYAGGQPVVHLVSSDTPDLVGSDASLKLEHFAFSATDRVAFEANLNQLGISYSTVDVPGTNLVQLHTADPDGNHIHIDFNATR